MYLVNIITKKKNQNELNTKREFVAQRLKYIALDPNIFNGQKISKF